MSRTHELNACAVSVQHDHLGGGGGSEPVGMYETLGLCRCRCTDAIDEAHQFGHGSDLELRHHPAAMHLDRFLARTELAGDLLVQQAASHEGADFPFARRQALVELSQVPGFLLASELLRLSASARVTASCSRARPAVS